MGHFILHDAPRATSEFQAVVRLDPDNPLGLAMLGRMYSFDPSKLNVSKELLERSLTIKPDNEEALFDLARVHAQLGDYEKSLDGFRRLLEQEKKFAMYRTELARILIAMGKKDEARKSLEIAVMLAPDFEPAKKLLNDINR